MTFELQELEALKERARSGRVPDWELRSIVEAVVPNLVDALVGSLTRSEVYREELPDEDEAVRAPACVPGAVVV